MCRQAAQVLTSSYWITSAVCPNPWVCPLEHISPQKMFHVPFDTDETHAAMRKAAGSDNSWSCVGENVLDVLVKMEREREKKDKLYWDLQLLNVGNLHTLYELDNPDVIDPHALNRLHQIVEPNTHNRTDSGSVESCTTDTDRSQRERPVGKTGLCASARGVERLKRSARQCWSRLASEGLRSILLRSPWQGQTPGAGSQAWGCVTLSDVLLLVGVKYDVVTHLLYKEMLQEHYTLNVWHTMLPWQQRKEEEELEDLAEEALESADMLCLAELPGAFRIYSVCLAAPSRGSPEFREQSWSAVSLLCDLHTFRQQERNTLTVLAERLDGESLTLLCLYIRLATLRAQREKMSYKALLVAQQSWETWPHVRSPCRADQASLWLHVQEEERERDVISRSPQQAALQLLVLSQEKEREQLVKLVQGVSLEDLQEPVCGVPQKEDNQNYAALRNGCIKRLKEIHSGLWMHHNTRNPLKRTNLQLQMQTDISSKPAKWSQHQLEDCSLVLLARLMELHEVQASVALPALMGERAQRVQALRDEYESQLRAQRYTNLLHLLISDVPLDAGSALTSYPNITERSSNERTATQSCCSAPIDAQSRRGGTVEAAISEASSELNGAHVKDGTDKQDVCRGCGAVMEDVPYLEILCVPDSTSHTGQRLAAEGEAQVEEEGSANESNQNYEKQGSLIALAWGKPPEDDADSEAKAAGQSQDVESSLTMQILPGDRRSTGERTQCDETSGDGDLNPTLFRSDSTGDPDAHAADRRCSTIIEARCAQTDAASGCDLPPRASGAEALRAEQPHLLVDDPVVTQHANGLTSGLTNEAADVEREVFEVEMGPTAPESELWGLREPEAALTEGHKYNSQPTVDCSPAERESTVMERERPGEAVSAMERERTMRNLVDMQRKVEQRQQRDRERQLLRVQERLSIIQTRKAEEDLLGLRHTDRLRHLTQDLPREDRNQQKTVVRERLEQLRRERSYVMQSKRDRNTAGFKELLGPVALHSRQAEDGQD